MPSFLQILKSLQDEQNPQDIDAYDYDIQTLDQPDLNLHDLQYHSDDQYGYRFIEYVPFPRKVIDYEERMYAQRVPVTKIVTEQVERVVVQTVPKQKIITDYFAIQHLRYYKKQKIPEKSIQYVPVVRTIKKTQFVPVERKIVHYPKDIDPQLINWNGHVETVQQSNFQMQKALTRQMFIKQHWGYEQDMIVTADASILNSLSKAYTPDEQQSEQQNEKKQINRNIDPVSPFQQTRKPSTFKEVDYRSTETIDSKYYMN